MLNFGFLHRKQVIADGLRVGIQVVPGRQHNGQHLVWNLCITKAVWWQVSRTSVQTGEPNGNDGTWTMTETKCTAIKRLISIMLAGD